MPKSMPPDEKAFMDCVATISDRVKNPLASLQATTEILEREIKKYRQGQGFDCNTLEDLIAQVRVRLFSITTYLDELSRVKNF